MKSILIILTLGMSMICFAQTSNKPIPGTKYSIAPPPNFVPAHQFSGFQNKELGASIMFTELPGDFHTITQGFNADGLASKGMTLMEKQEVEFNGLKALLIKVKQASNGNIYLKNILVFGDNKKCALVNGIYPESEKEIESEIKKSLLSTQYNENQSDNPLDAVDFSIDPTGTMFQFTKFIGGSLLYTIDGEVPTENPTFVVTTSIIKVDIKERKKFATERFKQLPRAQQATIEETKEVYIDGLNGYEIIANGKSKDEEPQLIYQVILFEPSGEYYIMIGTSTKDKSSSIDAYRKLSASFKRK